MRLDAVDEADLRWLFCDAAGEMGERSALGAMIDRLNEGRTHTGQAAPRITTSQYLAAARPPASPPDWSTSASATPARSKPPTARAAPASAKRFAGLGSGDTPARRPGAPRRHPRPHPLRHLDGWLTPRPAPSARHRGAAAEAKAVRGPPRRACRAVVDQWRSQVADHLRPIRLAAQMQLAAAHDAYRATYRLYPRQPCGRVDAE